MIERAEITGLVLAGGRGSRMGGVDKGLQLLHGRPLVAHALQRLAPQVANVMVSANRHLAAYEPLSACVLCDSVGGFAGPLAGILTGLERCRTPYLAIVPCDSPNLPLDLVERLGDALATAGAEIATAAVRTATAMDARTATAATPKGGGLRTQPVFSLLRADLASRLRQDLEGGERKADQWMARQRRVICTFADAAAFANINTLGDLERLEAGG